jgi:hypothetical protein
MPAGQEREDVRQEAIPPEINSHQLESPSVDYPSHHPPLRGDLSLLAFQAQKVPCLSVFVAFSDDRKTKNGPIYTF